MVERPLIFGGSSGLRRVLTNLPAVRAGGSDTVLCALQFQNLHSKKLSTLQLAKQVRSPILSAPGSGGVVGKKGRTVTLQVVKTKGYSLQSPCRN